MQAQAFLERHTPRLVEIANAASPELQGNAYTRQLLTQIHADFETVVEKPGKRPSLPGEDVFWWSITILEELTELTPGAPTSNPYAVMMLDQLRSIALRASRGAVRAGKREALQKDVAAFEAANLGRRGLCVGILRIFTSIAALEKG